MQCTAHRTQLVIGGVVGIALLWLLVAEIPAISRPGFSADEELTAIVVSSSRLLSVPVLPSGVVYLRGAAYLELAEIAGAILGRDIPSYRVVSLAFGLVNIALIAFVAARVFSWSAAAIVAVLLASSPLHAALAVFARPYTASIACFLLAWAMMPGALRGRRGHAAFLVLVAAAQTVHEAELLLVAIPLAYALTLAADDPRRGQAYRLTAETVALAIGLQVLFVKAFSASLARQLGAPEGLPGVFVLRSIPWPPLEVVALAGVPALFGAAAIAGSLAIWLRRSRLPWFELTAGAALAVTFQIGLLIAATLIGTLARPHRAKTYATACLMLGLASAVGWTIHTSLVTDAEVSGRLFTALVRSSASYPFEWVWLVAAWFPAAAACVAVTTAAAVYRPTPERRAAALLIWLMLMAFGVARIPGLDRYLAFVLPPVLLLAVAAIADVAAVINCAGRRQMPGWLAAGAATVFVCGAATVLAAEQRAQANRASLEIDTHRLGGWAPTYANTTYGGDPASKDCTASIPASDLLVCNDEPACQYLLQRVDAWLLPDAELRAGFTASRNGVTKGLYAGSLILEDQMALTRFIDANPSRHLTVMLLTTPKFGYGEQEAITRRAAVERGALARSCGPGAMTVRFKP